MQESNLISVLKSLSKKEIKKFNEYIHSPIFNKNENIIRLFEYLVRYYPEFPETKINKSEVFKVIFPGKKYNDGLMRKMMFQLKNLAEDYLFYISNNKSVFQTRFNFLNELIRRNLLTNYQRHFRELTDEIMNTEYRDKEYYYKRYLIETLNINYINKIRYNIDRYNGKIMYDEHVIKSLNHFKDHFILNTLSEYRYIYFQNYITQLEFKDDLLDNLINYLIEKYTVEQNKLTDEYRNPYIKLHLFELMLMKTRHKYTKLYQDKYYFSLKKILIEKEMDFPDDIYFNLKSILSQHCYYKILRGFGEYIKERFEIYKLSLSRGYYKSQTDIYFPSPMFLKFVMIAVQAGEINWAISFIDNYKNSLDPNHSEITMNLSLACINIGINKFQEALNYLNKITKIDRLEYKFIIKDMYLMIFYELSFYDQANYLIDSYNHFLKKMRNHFNLEKIEGRQNYVKYYHKLLIMKEKQELSELDNILDDLHNHNLVIYNRFWLLDKAKQLNISNNKPVI